MNFAIIGCGVIAQTHAKALVQLKEEGCILYAVRYCSRKGRCIGKTVWG